PVGCRWCYRNYPDIIGKWRLPCSNWNHNVQLHPTNAFSIHDDGWTYFLNLISFTWIKTHHPDFASDNISCRSQFLPRCMLQKSQSLHQRQALLIAQQFYCALQRAASLIREQTSVEGF